MSARRRLPMAGYDAARATAEDHVIPAKYPFAETVGADGARCSTCRYVSSDGKRCHNKRYREAMGTRRLGDAAARFCCMVWRGAK